MLLQVPTDAMCFDGKNLLTSRKKKPEKRWMAGASGLIHSWLGHSNSRINGGIRSHVEDIDDQSFRHKSLGEKNLFNPVGKLERKTVDY